MEGLFKTLVTTLLDEKTYYTLVVRGDFSDMAVFKLLLSRVLSYGILLGSLFYKLPQIFVISRARSGRGISLLALLLEILSCTATITYSVHMGFPLTTFGEAFFVVAMDLVIIYQIFYYDGRSLTGFFAATVIYVIALLALLSPVFPREFVPFCQLFVTPLVIFSRLPQIYANFAAGDTGSLSAITWGLNFAGSLGRIFTSMAEVGDTMVLGGFIVAGALNATILIQILMYGSKTVPKDVKAAPTKAKKKQL